MLGRLDLDNVVIWLFDWYMASLVNALVASGRTVRLTETAKTAGGVIPAEDDGWSLDECYICGDKAFTRGLCRSDYDIARAQHLLGFYPTESFVKNVAGHIHWFIENDLERLVTIGAEHGLIIE